MWEGEDAGREKGKREGGEKTAKRKDFLLLPSKMLNDSPADRS